MSDRKEVERRIERLLRKTALRGSDRSFDWDRPVGPGGLGLDSLALVEFVIAFEKEFEMEVSETLWTRLPEITPGYFVDLVVPRGGTPFPPGRAGGFLDRLQPRRWFRMPRKSQ